MLLLEQHRLSQCVQVINNLRAVERLTPLTLNTRLNAAAQEQADLIIRTGAFRHKHPTEHLPNVDDRVAATGYRAHRVAENISKGFRTPNTIVAAWEKSTPHRRAMLYHGARDIGLGMAKAPNGVLYVVAVFGEPHADLSMKNLQKRAAKLKQELLRMLKQY
jgi:uncharacterized protein YkwD